MVIGTGLLLKFRVNLFEINAPFVLDIFKIKKKSLFSFLNVCLGFLEKLFYQKKSILTLK